MLLLLQIKIILVKVFIANVMCLNTFGVLQVWRMLNLLILVVTFLTMVFNMTY